eukprot:jgi/Psemu1/288230/fgenesh1_pg.247_\
MPRKPAKLANCYVPLPLPPPLPSSPGTGAKESTTATPAARPDGRTHGHELRRLCLETSVVSRAAGSALIELGHTKVLAEVHVSSATALGNTGKSNNSNSNSDDDHATTDAGCLRCLVQYAPHVGIDRVAQRSRSVLPLDGNSNAHSTGSGGNRSTTGGAAAAAPSASKLVREVTARESDLSRRLGAALRPVVLLERYPMCCVAVQVTVLQDDGSCLSAAVAAASLALVDARVEVSDLVVSVSIVCLAMTPNRKEVTLWSQSGRLSSEAASRAAELCRDGCRTMHGFLREACLASEEREQHELREREALQ